MLSADRYGERFWQRLREELADAPAVVHQLPAAEKQASPASSRQMVQDQEATRPRTWLAPRMGWLW